MVDAAFVDADETAVANALGNAFAREVFALPPGAWHGPVASAYGFHLVRVGRIEPGPPRDFAEMKDHVLERWREHKQREAMDRYLAGLAAKHEIAVDASVAPLSGSAPSTLLRPVSGGAGTDAR
jgi:parvulin-like peptidyl-prolyl isomerase